MVYWVCLLHDNTKYLYHDASGLYFWCETLDYMKLHHFHSCINQLFLISTVIKLQWYKIVYMHVNPIYKCKHTHARVHTHTHTHTHTCTCTQTHIHKTHTHTLMQTHTHTHRLTTHISIHTHMHQSINAHSRFIMLPCTNTILFYI